MESAIPEPIRCRYAEVTRPISFGHHFFAVYRDELCRCKGWLLVIADIFVKEEAALPGGVGPRHQQIPESVAVPVRGGERDDLPEFILLQFDVLPFFQSGQTIRFHFHFLVKHQYSFVPTSSNRGHDQEIVDAIAVPVHAARLHAPYKRAACLQPHPILEQGRFPVADICIIAEHGSATYRPDYEILSAPFSPVDCSRRRRKAHV